jgi:hypothetical protein
MLGVSGIVPDGVAAAWLTAPDGTAVRADVVDNAYAFVVPVSGAPGLRYVVWVGGDGTPHVQPVPLVLTRPGGCPEAVLRAPRVTPGPMLVPMPLPVRPVPARPVPPRP